MTGAARIRKSKVRPLRGSLATTLVLTTPRGQATAIGRYRRRPANCCKGRRMSKWCSKERSAMAGTFPPAHPLFDLPPTLRTRPSPTRHLSASTLRVTRAGCMRRRTRSAARPTPFPFLRRAKEVPAAPPRIRSPSRAPLPTCRRAARSSCTWARAAAATA